MPRRQPVRGARGARARRNPALRITPRRHERQPQVPQEPPTTPAASAEPAAGPLATVRAIQPVELLVASEPRPPQGTLFQDDAPPIPSDDLAFEQYVERIESAAARSRAEQRRETRVRRAPAAAGARRRPGEPPRRRKQPKPFFKRRKTWFIIAALIPLLVVLAATVYVLNVVRLGIDAYGDINEDPPDRVRYRVNEQGTAEPVPEEEVEASMPNWDENDPFNMLLLGVDAQTAEDQPPRSDTAIVVHVDPKTKSVSMMSIPRDLYVYIPGHDWNKFNAAYPIGEVNEDEIEGGGVSLAAQTIEANFDIDIHHYATIDFEGFEKVVNTIGGVIVDVPNHLSDNLYPTKDLRYTRIYFSTGLQKLNGAQALQYVRTRNPDNDLGRAERQQQVLMAIREQANTRDLIMRADDLFQDLSDTVRTDLDFNQMLALANLSRGIDTQDIARYSLWDEGLLTEDPPDFDGDPYLLLADWPEVREGVAAFFGGGVSDTAGSDDDSGQAVPNLDTPVYVENATDIPLLAGNSTQLLVDAGFTAVWPGDARQPSERSIIENHTDDPTTAVFVADVLGLPQSSIVEVPGGEGITVILGDDVPGELLPDTQQTAG